MTIDAGTRSSSSESLAMAICIQRLSERALGAVFVV